MYASVTGSDRARRHALGPRSARCRPDRPPRPRSPTTRWPPCRSSTPTVPSRWRRVPASRRSLSTPTRKRSSGSPRALAAAPPDTSPRWRAELLVLSGEAHRHIGDIGAARQAFLSAAELTDDPALLARAALGYADPGADLGIAYRTDDAVTAMLLERAIAAQPSRDSVIAVQLEARLAAELYFSDEPSRAREHACVGARSGPSPRRRPARSARRPRSFTTRSSSARRTSDEQLAESAQLLDWARVDGIGVGAADRPPRPGLRSPRGRRHGGDGCRDPRVPPARRAAAHSRLPVVAGAVVGDARAARRAPRRGRGAGRGRLPDG